MHVFHSISTNRGRYEHELDSDLQIAPKFLENAP
jgi:hypothetical protein